MKVVLAAPNFPQPRGNTVTVKRIANRLIEMGISASVISITDETVKFITDAELVHGFHAYRFYEFLKRTGTIINPYLITITGTDLNHDFYDEKRKQGVLDVLEKSAAIHVFTTEAKRTIVKECPHLAYKIFVIPQGTSTFPDMDADIQKEQDSFVFLMPAGIRKVKNIPEAIHTLDALHKKIPQIRLWLAGPILEEEEGVIVKQLVEEHKSWIKYYGEVSFPEMGSLYNEADVLVNSSLSEGQASAILEALDHGKPVIVSGNQGNRSIVNHGKTGFIYENTNQFLDYAEQIVNNNKMRQEMGKQGKKYIASHHSGEKEAMAFNKLYQYIVNGEKMDNLKSEDLGLMEED